MTKFLGKEFIVDSSSNFQDHVKFDTSVYLDGPIEGDASITNILQVSEQHVDSSTLRLRKDPSTNGLLIESNNYNTGDQHTILNTSEYTAFGKDINNPVLKIDNSTAYYAYDPSSWLLERSLVDKGYVEGNFVTLDTPETITGEKTFTNPINFKDTYTTSAEYYLSVDGNGDYMAVPDNASLDISSGLTWSVWIRWNITSVDGNSNATIMDKSNSTWQSDIRLQHSQNNDKIEWSILEGEVIQSITTPQQNVWYHIVGTYDGSIMKLLVNNKEEGNKSVSGNIQNTLNALHIGCEAANQGREFSGDITDIRIYNTALSSIDVSTLYNNGKNSIGEPLDSGGNLVSRWNFSENDYTDNENGNDGTPYGDASINSDDDITKEHTLDIRYWAQDNVLKFGYENTKDILYHFSANHVGKVKTRKFIAGCGTDTQSIFESAIENGSFMFGFQKALFDIYNGYRWEYNQIDFVSHEFHQDSFHGLVSRLNENYTEYLLGHVPGERNSDEANWWRIRTEGGVDGEHDLIIGNFAGASVGNWDNEYLRIDQSTGDITFSGDVSIGNKAQYIGTLPTIDSSRDIPHKQYVDSQIEISQVSAWNGLTKSADGSIGLGGDLIQDTSILLTTDSLFEFKGVSGTNFKIAENYIQISCDNINDGVDFEFYFVPEGLSTGSKSGVEFRDYRTNTEGIKYYDDYSSGYTDRTLPDWGNVKAYVDSSLNSTTSNIDSSLNELYNENDIQDSSINDIQSVNTNQDFNITELQNKDTQIDSSLNELYNENDIQDSSINDIQSVNTNQDFNITTLQNKDTQIDSSLNELYNENDTQDISINDIQSVNSTQDFDITTLQNKDTQIDSSLNELYNENDTQDVSIDNLQSNLNNLDISIGNNYVSKNGDLMTGDLYVNPDVSVGGTLYAQNNVEIGGDLTIDGSIFYIDTTRLDISTNFIRLNSELTGTPPINLQSGIHIERGDLDPYVFLFDEETKTFNIGIASYDASTDTYSDASIQAVASRENNPQSNGIPYWNTTETRYDTTTNMQWTGTEMYVGQDVSINGRVDIGTGLSLLGLTDATSGYALVVNTNTGGEVYTRQLGSGAYADTANLTVNGPLIVSGGTDAVLNAIDISINQADVATDGYLSSTDWNDFDQKIDSVNNEPAQGADIYSREVDESVYLRTLTGGTNIVLTQDASTITIDTSGTSNSYSENFDASTGTQYTITAATHSLGTGPFHISVFDNSTLVYPDISFNASGDITIAWTSGTLGSNVDVFITC